MGVLFSVYSIMLLLFAACGPATPGDTAQPSVPLEGTEWLLVSIQGQAPAEGSKPELSFHPEEYVQGSTGCNTFGTSYTIHEGAFTTMVGWATRIRLEGERLELPAVRGETLTF